MAKRIKEPKPAELDPEIRLTQSEFVDLIKADHAVELAHSHGRAASIAYDLIEAQAKEGMRQATAAKQAAQDDVRAARTAHGAMAKALAERYAFDWATHSYCTETGVIRRVS